MGVAPPALDLMSRKLVFQTKLAFQNSNQLNGPFEGALLVETRPRTEPTRTASRQATPAPLRLDKGLRLPAGRPAPQLAAQAM